MRLKRFRAEAIDLPAVERRSASGEPALVFRDVEKAYGHVKALRGVSFSVAPGQVHALVGKNGAGKSTLVKILAGVVAPDRGEVVGKDGIHLEGGTTAHALRHGIRVVHQELSVIPDLTVWENVAANFQERLGPFVRRRRTIGRVRDVLDQLGGGINPEARAGSLSLANQQIVEIARALYAGGSMLVLDEPNSALSVRETDRLLTLIRRLADQGVSVMLVSHRLDEVLRVSHLVTVLLDGKVCGTFAPHSITAAGLVNEMTGGTAAEEPDVGTGTPAQQGSALNLDGLMTAGCGPVDLTVGRGQIMGLAGLQGSGVEALLQSLGGLAGRPSTGSITLDGRPVSLSSPSEAVRQRVFYIPPDRRTALWLERSIEDNIAAGGLAKVSRWMVVQRGRKRRNAVEWAHRLGLPPDRTGESANVLSGGNQQRVLLARVLNGEPRVLLMEDPTRGIDARARVSFHRLLHELAQGGVTILWSSSDLAELPEASHRIACLRGGRVTRVVDASEVGEAELLAEVG